MRGSVYWGCYYDTALDIEVDPQRCCFGSRQSDFALQAVVPVIIGGSGGQGPPEMTGAG